jgi:hypothetical protein
MAASDGLLPSPLPRVVVSLDTADGDVGLRSFAASFLLLNGPVDVKMSICASSDCVVDSPGLLTCDVPSAVGEKALSCPSREVPVLCGSVTLILGSKSAMLMLTAQLLSWMYPGRWAVPGRATAASTACSMPLKRV